MKGRRYDLNGACAHNALANYSIAGRKNPDGEFEKQT